jgi:hypothetical protein
MNQRRSTIQRWLAAPPLLLAAGIGLLATTVGGCYARARTGAVVTAEYVPPRVETYPSYEYEGRVVYLVGDRWYYHHAPPPRRHDDHRRHRHYH